MISSDFGRYAAWGKQLGQYCGKARAIAAFLLVICAVAVSPAKAHDIDQGYVYFSILDAQLDVRVELNIRDINRALTLGLPEDGSATQADIETSAAAIRAYLRERLAMRPDGKEVDWQFIGFSLRDTKHGQFLLADFTVAELPATPEFVGIDYNLLFDVYPAHRGFALIENDWRSQVFENEAGISLVFSPSDRSQRLDLGEGSVMSGITGMIESGAHHIWIGYDHILFLLALLLPSVMRREGRRWVSVDGLRPAIIQVVKIVTMFTVGHTVTLTLAALGVVSLPSRLVESVIAVSIAFAAIEIFFPIFGKRVLLLIFTFGLFHGFGFANVLAEMPIPSVYVLPSLFGFNVGVELGQLAIVLVVVPILYMLRNFRPYARVAMPVAASLLVMVSLYWFTERAFDIDLQAGAFAQDLLGLR